MEGLALKPGDVIAAKYRVDRVLGRGGMGIVVAAHHVHLDDRVAIKLLAPEVKALPEAVERFVREARAAVQIRSEHVVRVFDVGSLEDGTPFMVMEFLQGTDFASELAKAPLPTELVLDYVLQACEALAEAHKRGIVHRDLKPANLFVTHRADDSVLIKLLDFGISKAQGGPDGGITKTAVFMGSPQYAPPEQIMSARSADARSDIWALGVMLYEALGRQLPFKGESVMEIAAGILQATPPALSTLRPDLPPSLCAIVMRCLEKKPDARFQSIGELARALAPFAAASRASIDRISRVMGESTNDVMPATPAANDSARASAPTTDVGMGLTQNGGTTVPVRPSRPIIIGLVAACAVATGIFAWPKRGPSASSTVADVKPPTSAVEPVKMPAAESAAVAKLEAVPAAPRPSATDSAPTIVPSSRVAPPAVVQAPVKKPSAPDTHVRVAATPQPDTTAKAPASAETATPNPLQIRAK